MRRRKQSVQRGTDGLIYEDAARRVRRPMSLLQCIDLAVAAEELGADGAYFRINHFARQLASPFPLLAAVGAKTSRIEIGTAVIDMRYENPFHMAEDAGAADLTAGGASNSASVGVAGAGDRRMALFRLPDGGRRERRRYGTASRRKRSKGGGSASIAGSRASRVGKPTPTVAPEKAIASGRTRKPPRRYISALCASKLKFRIIR
jgi:hypothetical protein